MNDPYSCEWSEQVANSEGFTVENTENLPVVGILINNWRKRRVNVHSHPTDCAKVISIGYPMDGGEPVVCVESVEEYERVLLSYPSAVVYD